MSNISMHALSAPVFARMLRNLKVFLQKGEAHAKAKGFDPAVLLTSRLAPDMHPLGRQIQIACDAAKGAMYRLAGQTPPSVPDEETTLAEFYARIDKTLALIEAVPASALDDAADREVTIAVPNMELKFKGSEFLGTWAFPNFFFHVTTAYAILRHNGVELGKREFLMGGGM